MSSSGVVLVVLAAVFATAANLIFKAAMQHATGLLGGSFTDALSAFLHLLFQPLFFAGLICFLLSSVTWFRVVATEPLGTAYPALVGLTFIFLAATAAIFFSEELSVRKVLGVAIIFAGVVLISTKGSAS